MSDKKVILLDVSSLLRTGIQGLLAEHGYQTAAQFLTIEAMHSALPELHADLIIMEHLQQSPEVFSHLVQIRKAYPAIKVLILSSSSSDFHIQLSRRPVRLAISIKTVLWIKLLTPSTRSPPGDIATVLSCGNITPVIPGMRRCYYLYPILISVFCAIFLRATATRLSPRC